MAEDLALRERVKRLKKTVDSLLRVTNQVLPLEVFDTVSQARLAAIQAVRVDIRADGNGDPATFWRDATYVDDGFDVTGFADAAGTTFRRLQWV